MNDRKVVTTRISSKLVRELKIIAAKNERRFNDELEESMKRYIDAFNKKENK